MRASLTFLLTLVATLTIVGALALGFAELAEYSATVWATNCDPIDCQP